MELPLLRGHQGVEGSCSFFSKLRETLTKFCFKAVFGTRSKKVDSSAFHEQKVKIIAIEYRFAATLLLTLCAQTLIRSVPAVNCEWLALVTQQNEELWLISP